MSTTRGDGEAPPTAAEGPSTGSGDARAPRAPRAVIYVWTEATRTENVAEIARCEALARAAGLAVVARLVEDDWRGPKLKRVFAWAKAKRIDVVFVASVDELAVGPAAVVRVARRLRRLGVRLVSESEPWFDVRSPALVWLAEGERRRLSRAAKTRREMRERGERTGAIPYGLRLSADRVSLEPDDNERRVVAHVYELADAGHSLRAIARVLARSGFRSRADTPYTHRQVGRILAKRA